MSTWNGVLKDVRAACSELGSTDGSELFFRGQTNAEWGLVASLARAAKRANPFDRVFGGKGEELSDEQRLENILYYQLLSRGGHLVPKNPKPWEILFLMRHHRLPTRLLDWSRSFGVGLFFAVTRTSMKSAEMEGPSAAVWILNPARLNTETRRDKSEVVCYLDTDYPLGYEQYFANHLGERYGSFPHSVVAAWADASNERLRAQKGAFTLHRDLSGPLEKTFPSCVRKIVVPRDIFPEASEFLNLAGIDNASLFPDLDSLAELLVQQFGV